MCCINAHGVHCMEKWQPLVLVSCVPRDCSPFVPYNVRGFQEFVRAILHINPTALQSRDGSTSDMDLVRSKPGSPRGYFDGMPGRPLGTGGENDDTTQNTHRQRARPRPSSAGNERRSPPPRDPGSLPDGAAGWGDAGSPTAGLAAAAARLRLERDAKEERRAWAQRAGVGRVGGATTTKGPPVSPRAGPTPEERRGGRAGAESSGSARRRRGRERSVGGGEETASERDTASAGATAEAAAAHVVASEKSEAATDVISQAFERYARDRDRDRDGDARNQRLRQRSPPGDPFAFALQPGGDNQQKRQLVPSAGSDNEDGVESDGSSSAAEDNDYYTVRSSPSVARGHSRRGRTGAEKRPTGGSRLRKNADVSSKSWERSHVAGVNSGDEGGGRGRGYAPLSSGKTGRSSGGEGTAERRGGRSFESSGEESSASEDEEGDATFSGPERERALRKAFDMYDLNGDGFITYLEVGMILDRS